MAHLNGNLLVAIDFETTGERAGHHEPIQIAIQPLNADIRPLAGVRPFYTTIKPLRPERADPQATAKHGLSIEELVLHAPEPDKVADLLVEWFEGLDLPFNKCLVPLAHNWTFEHSFLKAWLGPSLTAKLFYFHPRDAMIYALALNDRAAFLGEPAPFNRVGLTSLCSKLSIVNTRPHDALHDALAEAEVYRTLLVMDVMA